MIVLDTSVLYALLDAADDRHTTAASWYEGVQDELVTTPLVLAETDHLALTRGGANAVAAFRRDLRAGAYSVEWWATAAREAADVADQYADLSLGLTDASLIVLAARVGSVKVATFDQRHFRAVRPLAGGAAFELLPLDATA